MNTKTKTYLAKTSKERKALVAALLQLGYPFRAAGYTVETLDRDADWGMWPRILIDDLGRIDFLSGGPYPYDVSLEWFLAEPNRPVVIEGVGDYAATVVKGDGFVTVGCQKIDISKINEIVAAWNELNPYLG